MSAISDYFTSLKTKLSSSTFVTNADNIVFGESIDVMRLGDSSFPRLEILVVKLKNNGYLAQRQVLWSIRYAIAGYIKIDNSGEFFTQAELTNLTNFAKQTVDLNYQFLDDKQNGNSPCTGFEMLGEFPEIFIEKELIPNTACFIADLEAQIYISDTEVL